MKKENEQESQVLQTAVMTLMQYSAQLSEIFQPENPIDAAVSLFESAPTDKLVEAALEILNVTKATGGLDGEIAEVLSPDNLEDLARTFIRTMELTIKLHPYMQLFIATLTERQPQLVSKFQDKMRLSCVLGE